jgi:formiminotetrahydrofolate cyclodeaminase
MVAGLTANREEDHARVVELQATTDHLNGLRERMLAAALADEAAYGAYRAASSLPRQTAREKADRRAAVQHALAEATEVPLEVARGAVTIAVALGDLARIGNPRLAADIALGTMLAETALRGSLLNIRSNAATLADQSLATRVLSEAARLEREGHEAVEAALHAADSATNPP